MKAVALNTSRSEFSGEWKHTSDLGHFGVKCGIETCRLRNPWKMLLGEADYGQCRRRVQGSKGGGRLDLLEHRSIDQTMLP